VPPASDTVTLALLSSYVGQRYPKAVLPEYAPVMDQKYLGTEGLSAAGSEEVRKVLYSAEELAERGPVARHAIVNRPQVC
jgi:hypothetical protein